MKSQIPFEDLAQLLANHQGALFGYIAFLVGRVDDVPEILQQTNLALLRKAVEFQPGSNFLAWARGVAYFEVLTFRRERGAIGTCSTMTYWRSSPPCRKRKRAIANAE